MLAIIDARSSKEAKENLSKYVDDILFFETSGITYASISGHPDIFIFQESNKLIIAPNSAEQLFSFLKKHKVDFQIGESEVGKTHKDSVKYNCVASDNFLLHKEGFTDVLILKIYPDKKFINIPQAYTRCSMLHVKNDIFITSDSGINKVLDNNKIRNFFFSPENIQIIDHKNGFFGGTCGIFCNKIFFNGNINKHKDGAALSIFLEDLNFEIICLHDDYLFDGGGIFFIK